MKKIILFLLIVILVCSCANLFTKRSNFGICMDCLHYKNYTNAIEYCKRATLDEPNNFNAYHFLGIAYVNTGQLENALICFDKAIQINPEFPNAWGWKGGVLKKLGRDDEGEECIKKSEELDAKQKSQVK